MEASIFQLHSDLSLSIGMYVRLVSTVEMDRAVVLTLRILSESDTIFGDASSRKKYSGIIGSSSSAIDATSFILAKLCTHGLSSSLVVLLLSEFLSSTSDIRILAALLNVKVR